MLFITGPQPYTIMPVRVEVIQVNWTFIIRKIVQISRNALHLLTTGMSVVNYEYSWCSTYRSHLTIPQIFFLFVWFKYLIFYISKVLFLHYLYVVLFYKFDYLKQYLWESFNTASGFHFETKSPTSGSHVFYLLIQLNEKFKTPFLSLKNINEIT